MAEAQNENIETEKKTRAKAKIDWAELGLNLAMHATSAIISGFCLAAGGFAFSEVSKPRRQPERTQADVVNIHRKQS